MAEIAAGVGTVNMFALLDDDAPKKKAPQKQEPKKEEPKPKEQNNRGDRRNNRNRGDRRENRDNRNRGDRGDRNRGERRENRGPRGPRGPRGGNGDTRGPQRQFDRRSQNGRDRSNKKDGAGKGNWGSNAEASLETAEATPEVVAETPKEEATEEVAAVVEKTAEADEGDESEEDTNITYDEYLARTAAAKPAADIELKVREANNDEDKWEACVEASKATASAEVYASEHVNTKSRRRKNKNKKAIISFDEFSAGSKDAARAGKPRRDENRGGRGRGRGRGRGGRGRGRGGRDGGRGRGGRGRGRGGPRGPRSNGGYRQGGNNNINVEDEKAFPKLG